MHPVCHSGLCPLQASIDWHPEPREARHIQAVPVGETLALACSICSSGLAFFIGLGWIFPEELFHYVLLHSWWDCQHKLPTGFLNTQPQVNLFLHSFSIPTGSICHWGSWFPLLSCLNVVQKFTVGQSFITKFCLLLCSGLDCTEIFLSELGWYTQHFIFEVDSIHPRSPYHSCNATSYIQQGI